MEQDSTEMVSITNFFGLPTQRYWRKDISPNKARRLNMIYSSLRGNDVSAFASDSFTSKFFSADQISEINRIRTESNTEAGRIVKAILTKEWVETMKIDLYPLEGSILLIQKTLLQIK